MENSLLLVFLVGGWEVPHASHTNKQKHRLVFFYIDRRCVLHATVAEEW